MQVLGSYYLKDLYEVDVDFQKAFKACKNPVNRDRIPWKDFILHVGLLFKNSQLCIPNCSMREILIQEKNNGVLEGHSTADKTLQ